MTREDVRQLWRFAVSLVIASLVLIFIAVRVLAALVGWVLP